MSKERLELIKNRRKNYRPDVLPIWCEDMDWLIEQAERVEELGVINKELHDRRKKLRQQNKRYREAMEEIKRKIKNNDNRIERLSSERQFYDQSKKIERLHGEALGLEMALKIIDEALEDSK